jgi:hypothetical protein
VDKYSILGEVAHFRNAQSPQHVDDRSRASMMSVTRCPHVKIPHKLGMKRKVSDDPEKTPWVEQWPGNGDEPA